MVLYPKNRNDTGVSYHFRRVTDLFGRVRKGIFKEKRAKVEELSHEGYLQQITLDLSLSTNLPALDQPVSYPRPLREPLASPSLLKEDDSGSGRIFQYELTSAKFGNNSAPQEPPVLQEAVGVSSRLRGLVNEWSKHAQTPEAFMNLVGKYLKSEQFYLHSFTRFNSLA